VEKGRKECGGGSFWGKRFEEASHLGGLSQGLARKKKKKIENQVPTVTKSRVRNKYPPVGVSPNRIN